ncbi:MAG: hypothetical protein ACTSXQ_06770 [Alphaproteobacteria bacterium]
MAPSSVNFPKTSHQIASQSYQRANGQNKKTDQGTTGDFQRFSTENKQASAANAAQRPTPQPLSTHNAAQTDLKNLVQQIAGEQWAQEGGKVQAQSAFNDHGFANKAYVSSMGLESKPAVTTPQATSQKIEMLPTNTLDISV